MSFTIMISLASDSKIAPLTISSSPGDNPGQELKGTRGSAGCPQQALPLRIFADRFE